MKLSFRQNDSTKNIKQHFVIGVFFLRTHQLHTEQQFTYIDTDQSEIEGEREKATMRNAYI